jgi:tubulin-specific chaperone D
LEKIDKLRATGGKLLIWLLKSDLYFEDKEKLVHLLDTDINWLDPKEVYPLLILALDTAYYSSVILGFVLCIGGLTETLVRHSSASLISYVNTPERQVRIAGLLAQHLRAHKTDRIIMP